MRDQPLPPGAFSQRLGPLGFLTGIFLLNFTGRVSLAPLMPNIETDLGMNHAQAGMLFLFMSVGYFLALFFFGALLSQRLTHRRVNFDLVAVRGRVMLCLGPL